MSKEFNVCGTREIHVPNDGCCDCTTYAFSKVRVENELIAADSSNDTLELKAGANIHITPDQNYDSVTISADDHDTQYDAGVGIVINGTLISHSDYTTAGTAGGTSDTSGTTVEIPYVTYNTQGHVTASGTRTHTVPSPRDAGTGLSLSGNTINHSNSITAGTAGGTSDTSGTSITIPYVTYDAQGHITGKGTRTHTVPSQTTYSAGTGLSMSGTTINHSNSVTAGTAGGTADTSGTSISIPYITYDAQGHVTGKGTRTHTVPTPTTYSAGTGLSMSGSTINHSNSVTAGTAGTTTNTSGSSISIPYVVYDAQGHVTGSGTRTHTISEGVSYQAGTGLSLSGTTFNHSNSVTAGTAGSTSSTSGNSITIPYVTYDAQGHITASGTRTHTVPSATTYSAGSGISIDSNNAIGRAPLRNEYVCMATEYAPDYPGTYVLIKKCFTPMFETSRYVNWNTPFVDSTNPRTRFAIMRMDDRICIDIRYVVTQEITDYTINVCTIPMANLGLSDATPSYSVGFSDADNGIVYHDTSVDGTNLKIDIIDYLPHNNPIDDDAVHVQLDLVFSQSDMLSSACDRFYYRRTD